MTMSPLETLETLSTLHALQQNLSLTKEILTAASTYNNTLQKIPSLLTPTTLNQGVQALIALENGARALSGMPGKSQRNEEIVQIRNQILTLLKPVLSHALNKMESRLGPLQTCVGMYQSLNKMERMMEEYVKSRPASIHKLWFDFRKSSVNIGRFESLTSCFRAQQALECVDLLLSRHISEMSSHLIHFLPRCFIK